MAQWHSRACQWTVLADIKTVKPNFTREERSTCVIKDLGVPPTSLAAAALAALPGGTTVLRLLGQNKGPKEVGADLQRDQPNNTVEVPTCSGEG